MSSYNRRLHAFVRLKRSRRTGKIMSNSKWGTWKAIRNCFILSLLLFGASAAVYWLETYYAVSRLSPEEREAIEDIGMINIEQVVIPLFLFLLASAAALLGVVQMALKAHKYR